MYTYIHALLYTHIYIYIYINYFIHLRECWLLDNKTVSDYKDIYTHILKFSNIYLTS